MLDEFLTALRDEGAGDIRVHGNGFIQLDLDERRRLHVWGHPDVPKQVVSTPIHDHVFGFHSEILVGRLVNVVYEEYPSPEGEFMIYEPVPRHGEDTVLRPTGQKLVVEVSDTLHLIACSKSYTLLEYDFEPFVFHEMFAPEPSVTIITKHGPTLAENPTGRKPRVLVPLGVEPDNKFDRYDNDPSRLWRIIYEVLEL